MCDIIGRTATLITPYQGYRNIEIVAREGVKWTAIICGSSKLREVYEDEFILD